MFLSCNYPSIFDFKAGKHMKMKLYETSGQLEQRVCEDLHCE